MEDDNKEKIIIEIQNDRESDYLERILYGTSKVIVDYLKLGKEYKDVSKVISVSILYFNLGVGDDYIYYGTTEFNGVHTKNKLNVKSKAFIIDDNGNEKIKFKYKNNIFLEYYIINVEKFSEIVEEDIDEWIYMLKTSEIKKEFKSKNIDIARERLKYEDLNEEEKRIYERHIENIVRERDIMETAKEEGREEGAILSRREDILENLDQISTVTDDIIKTVNEENDIKILKKWLRISMMVVSLEDFISQIDR